MHGLGTLVVRGGAAPRPDCLITRSHLSGVHTRTGGVFISTKHDERLLLILNTRLNGNLLCVHQACPL